MYALKRKTSLPHLQANSHRYIKLYTNLFICLYECTYIYQYTYVYKGIYVCMNIYRYVNMDVCIYKNFIIAFASKQSKKCLYEYV
jgi:hypothetical protein